MTASCVRTELELTLRDLLGCIDVPSLERLGMVLLLRVTATVHFRHTFLSAVGGRDD